MAELVSMEKLQPCLLDRLTDLQPDKTEEGRSERVVSMSRYRDGVLRDIRWLLGTSNHLPEEAFNAFPEVKGSTLNYGTRNLCGHLSSSIHTRDLERGIVEAIERFEPRLDKRRLSVKVHEEGSGGGRHEVLFEIRGELWARPISEELFVKTRLDLETGNFSPG
jgi:type VI secretion system protein ImpF